jgi:hypothetical protein
MIVERCEGIHDAKFGDAGSCYSLSG